MRAIKRNSIKLNTRKYNQVIELVHAYFREKDAWFCYLQSPSNIKKTDKFREIRDEFVGKKYVPPTGLPANHWKNALEDACKQMNMHWKGVFSKVKLLVARNDNLSKEQKRWCYTVLKSYDYFQALRQRQYPVFDFLGDRKVIKTVGHYLNRIVSRKTKKLPRAKLHRSMMLTSITYTIKKSKTDERKQFISVQSMTKGKPILIPLLGYTRISGNVRLVLAGDHVEVHYTAKVKGPHKSKGIVRAIDIGYTEAFVDDEGSAYGAGFGALLSEKSDAENKKNRQRNLLAAIKNKALAKGDLAKARRIEKFNLGKTKLKLRNKRVKATLENIMNGGLNKFLKEKHPDVLVTEKLGNMKVPNKGKKLNRHLTAWTRGILMERISFKALVGCSHHEQVNPAYSSQTCPFCGYVHPGNRSGDVFKCRHCGHEGDADQIAATNLRSRYGDREISLYVPYKSVKAILDQRFHRRVETLKKGTVPGRTLDTGKAIAQS